MTQLLYGILICYGLFIVAEKIALRKGIKLEKVLNELGLIQFVLKRYKQLPWILLIVFPFLYLLIPIILWILNSLLILDTKGSWVESFYLFNLAIPGKFLRQILKLECNPEQAHGECLSMNIDILIPLGINLLFCAMLGYLLGTLIQKKPSRF